MYDNISLERNTHAQEIFYYIFDFTPCDFSDQ